MILLDWFVRASVVLALALLAPRLLRRRSAVARRTVLTIALAAVLVIPLLPAWHIGGPSYHALVGRLVAEPSGAEPGGAGALAAASRLLAASSASASFASFASGASAVARSFAWLALVWAVGALVVGARFALGLVLARRLARRASPATETWEAAITRAERVTGLRAVVRISSEIEAPAVTGIFAAVTLVPAASVSWSDERRFSVLLHELAHVAAHDLGVQVLAALVCSLHWFNPLSWLTARRLRLERELAADEAVLRSGMRASSYAADLLAIAAVAGAPPAGAIAISEEPLAKRIAAIVAERRPTILGRKQVAAIALGSASVALAVACATTSEPANTEAVATASAVANASAVEHVDRDLQVIADRELGRAIDDWGAAGGTILVMSPRGDVLASAGRADEAYVTGSTLKAVLLAAAIDEGAVGESDVFDCTRGDRGGKVLHDATPLGQVALPELVARSGNVGFAQIFDRLGGERVDRALRRFHFATPPELSAAAPPGDWNGGLVAIGATMSATPRQVARAYATLAGGGEGIVTPTTAARVGALLEGVVASEHGTGKMARVAGARVAGKTGSSEWTTASGARKTYASFVGYVPAERPRYVVFVGVESPRGDEAWGGDVAAPVFARVAAQALAR